MTPRVPIGTDDRRLVTLGEKELETHGFGTGTTGAGKTGYFLSFLIALMQRCPESPCVVVDGKGEFADETCAFLTAAAAAGRPILRPDHVRMISPFKKAAVPSNPLVPDPRLDPSTQAVLFARLLGSITPGWGVRMERVVILLGEAIIRAGRGSLRDLRRCVVDAEYAAALSRQFRARPELHTFLEAELGTEPATTLAAIAARLDYLIAFPPLRAAICADGAPPNLLSGRLTVLSLGGAPYGNRDLARYVGGIYWNALVSSIAENKQKNPAFVLVDEVQQVLQGDGDDLEQTYSLARSNRVSITAACQLQAQLADRSPKLLASMLKNSHRRIIFRPDQADLAEIATYLGSPVGRVNPAVPDTRLSSQAEIGRRLEDWHDLPNREFIHINRMTGQVEHLRTLELPYARVHRLVSEHPALHDAYERGGIGRPWQELREAPSAVPELPTASDHRPPSSSPGPGPKRRGRLVLP